MRQLQHEDEGLLRPELQVIAAGNLARFAGRWLLAALCLSVAPPLWAQDEGFRAAVAALPQASFPDKQAIAGRILASRQPGARPVLTALLEDRLYFRTADNTVFIVATAGASPLDLIDPVTLKSSGSAAPDTLEMVSTNNQLRRQLRTSLARFALADADPAVRFAAVTDMTRSLDAATVAVLQERSAVETDAAVRRAIETGLALSALDSTDAARRLAAVATLRSRLGSEVRNRLAALVETAADGTPAESDTRVRKAAAEAIAGIDSSRRFYSTIETLFFGLSLGSVLVLVAIGLAITFGVMGVINMAHGELMMLGAYTTYVVQLLMPHHLGASIVVAIPAAFLVTALVGIVIEQTIIRFLYGRPLETLLATFGVSLLLQQLVRSVFSANNRAVATPPWLSGTLQINDALALTWIRLYIVLFTMAVFVTLLLVLKQTRLGLRIRAVAQNRAMARAMGIRSSRVDALTFGLGAGIAGIAGVALSQLTNVGPNLGQAYIVDAFMVVVFGGVGSLWGTLLGGMSLGIVNKVLEPYAGAVLGKVVMLVALVLFIQRRPRGLFPPTGRAAESY
jgi:urea transport system permease protein